MSADPEAILHEIMGGAGVLLHLGAPQALSHPLYSCLSGCCTSAPRLSKGMERLLLRWATRPGLPCWVSAVLGLQGTGPRMDLGIPKAPRGFRQMLGRDTSLLESALSSCVSPADNSPGHVWAPLSTTFRLLTVLRDLRGSQCLCSTYSAPHTGFWLSLEENSASFPSPATPS